MAEGTTTNAGWFERATAVIPGGVDSPVRSFRSVGGTPYTVVEGHGPRRRGHRVSGSGAVLRGEPARPRAPGGHRGDPDSRAEGDHLRSTYPRRGAAGGGHRGEGAGARAGQVRLFRHRGGDERSPSGSRRDRSRQDREVRWVLPRARRPPAGSRRERGRRARPPGLGWRAARCRGRHHRRALQPGADPERRRGLRPRRAGRRQHEPRQAGGWFS